MPTVAFYIGRAANISWITCESKWLDHQPSSNFFQRHNQIVSTKFSLAIQRACAAIAHRIGPQHGKEQRRSLGKSAENNVKLKGDCYMLVTEFFKFCTLPCQTPQKLSTWALEHQLGVIWGKALASAIGRVCVHPSKAPIWQYAETRLEFGTKIWTYIVSDVLKKSVDALDACNFDWKLFFQNQICESICQNVIPDVWHVCPGCFASIPLLCSKTEARCN